MEILKVIRKHGWTIDRVADNMISKTGNSLSCGSLSTMIHGNITVESLRKIATIIGANMTEFFEDEQPEVVQPSLTFENTITLNGETYGLVKIEKS